MAALKGGTYKTAADVQKAGTQALYKAGGGDAAMKSGVTRAQVIAQGVKATPSLKAKPAPTPSKTPTSSTPSSSTPSSSTSAPPPAKPKTPTPAKSEKPPEKAPEKPPEKAPETPAEKPAEKAKPAKIDYGVGEIATIKRQNPALTPKDIERIIQRGKPGDGSAPMTPTFAARTPLPAPAGSALEAEQERRRKAAAEKAAAAGNPAAGTTKESYDAYDIVLEYLISGGHVESISEAHYVMLEMDSETIQSIVEMSPAMQNLLSRPSNRLDGKRSPALPAAAPPPGATGKLFTKPKPIIR